MPCRIALGSTVIFCVFGIALAGGASPDAPPRPIELTPKGTIAGARQPQAAVVGRDTVHVAFAAGETVRVVTSTDGGKTFAAPGRVGELTGLMAGMRRGPRIAADANTIVVSAIGSKEGNLVAWRSSDRGRTWLGPVTVNDVPRSCREGLHGMAIGPRGQIACVWLDLRAEKTELWCAVSSDGGATWGENHRVYRSPEGSICECCHPSVAYDSKGTLFAMWRNSLGGNRDIYLATSTDDGTSFSRAAKLGGGSWRKDACPMDGGAVAVVSPGKAATIWRRDLEIFLTPAGELKEQRLGRGEQPTIAVHGGGAYTAWVDRRPGSLVVKAPKASKPMELAKSALDPMLASGSDPDSPVVIVWETGKGKDTSIWFASLTGAPR